MNEKIVSLIKKYVGAFLMLGAATGVILMLRDHWAAEDIGTIYLNLSDAFAIPAVVMLMVAVLIWVSTTGNFDMLTYGFSRAKGAFIPSPTYKHEQFYDYKVRKDQKRIKGYSFLFVAGGIYLIPAIVFNILHACL